MLSYDKLELVFLYGESVKSFNEMYSDYPIDYAYTSWLIKKFKETLSLRDKKRSEKSEAVKNTKIDIVAYISADPKQSLAVGALHSICDISVKQNLLKFLNCYIHWKSIF